jgi:uncharacterized cupredoxin-like copper-binding protein
VPDEIVRIDRELMRVVEVLDPARLEVTRAEEGSVAHAGGTELIAVIEAEEDGGDPTFEPTGVFLAESTGAGTGQLILTSIGRISAGSTYMLDDEEITVDDVLPAHVRVERGVDGTEITPHGRRLPLYAGNAIEVERGFDGTTAAAHDAGDDVLMTEIRVEREQDGSELLDHAKNAEIYLGNSLIVERGVLETEAAEHQNGSLIRDFPPAPGDPPILMASCGQKPAGGGGATTRPTPVPGSQEVGISLTEWAVDPAPASIASGSISFIVANDGSTQHNFRVIRTDLAADQLPVTNNEVDATQVQFVAQSDTIGARNFGLVLSSLDPGSYVLICNVPTHYENGMHTAFEVTP